MQYDRLLLDIINQAKPHLARIAPADMRAKPLPHKWSKLEILGHLIDSAYNNHQRFLRAESQADLIFNGYEQDKWVTLNAYQERPVEEVIQMWYHANLHLAHLISQLPQSLLARTTTAHNFHVIGMRRPTAGAPSSLGYLIRDYLFHLEHHLQQLLPAYQVLLLEE